MNAEIQQRLAAAHKQWKQEHDTVIQETVIQALGKAKHEYEGNTYIYPVRLLKVCISQNYSFK